MPSLYVAGSWTLQCHKCSLVARAILTKVVGVYIKKGNCRLRDDAPGHECGEIKTSFQNNLGHAILTGNHNAIVAVT